eukprot:TRINITY_DN8507_c0_g1_i1.p1 TRINITY_DN8507_c0_g1~~TRINITY_DN8507_c0_g1_i1.p1  ORF type:complete len:279 (+),score=99.28 TRINITY_DN8507_c0_g1_i1:49-837(+)
MDYSQQTIQTVKRDKSGKRLVTKVYGPTIQCNVMHYPDHMKLEALEKEVEGLCVVERFVDKCLVYFTGDMKERKKGKHVNRKAFRKEQRESRVLILSVKGKNFIMIEEAVDIVMKSCLWSKVQDIELIGINPRSNPATTTSHIYVQFRTVAMAESCVNTVDAMPYKKGFYVHSPQCDEHAQFFPNRNYKEESHIWRNPTYVSDPPSPIHSSVNLSSHSSISTPSSSLVATPVPTPPLTFTHPPLLSVEETTYCDHMVVEFYM